MSDESRQGPEDDAWLDDQSAQLRDAGYKSQFNKQGNTILRKEAVRVFFFFFFFVDVVVLFLSCETLC